MFNRARIIWICAIALTVLAVWLGLSGLKPATAYLSEQISHQSPFQARHGLPSGAHRLARQETADHPVFFVEETLYSFGMVKRGSLAQHVFVIFNHGSGALVIDRAYTTCDCTTANFSASVIPPGMAALVEVIYDPGLHAPPGQTVRRGVIIETNDPQQSVRELWIEARTR